MKKIIRTSTVAMSLDILLKGQLSFLNEYYKVVAVSGEDKHLITVRNREKVTTLDVNFERQISPLKDLVSLFKLYKVLKREKPFIIHSITPKAGLLSMIAGYFAGVPVRLHTFTGLIFPSKKGILKQLLIFMDKLLCKFATQVYPEGQGVKNDLIKYRITSKPLKIIANGNVNGVDLEYFNPNQITELCKRELKNKFNINQSDFIFVFVGRIVTDKGINELVAAFDSLSEIHNNCKLLLVGNQEEALDPLLAETKHSINNNKNIISVGYQDDVRPYLAISNCLVFPSYREGFPNVVLQAGAMGLVSIVSDINGCNEIIIEGENGLIIPPKNEEAICNAMKKILENKELTLHLSCNARQLITSRYNQQLVWNAILEEYRTFEK